MNFTTVSEGHNCNCYNNASENCVDTFARKVSDTKDLKIRDFRTHSERGLIPDNDSCDEICGYKGLSINLWNDQSKRSVTDKFSLTLAISPMIKKPSSKIGVFKFLPDAGKVKHTPNQRNGVDTYHYDLYKSDEFVIEKVVLIEMISFV
ncbi:hypothetical protein [Spirosoma jeollabukense]